MPGRDHPHAAHTGRAAARATQRPFHLLAPANVERVNPDRIVALFATDQPAGRLPRARRHPEFSGS